MNSLPRTESMSELQTGENFNLVANFLKRHSNLRCVVKHDLRLFPERYVVCVSCAEDALEHHGNPSQAATELREQTRSEYFSNVGETQELLHSPTKTKKSVLQKIAKQASVQQKVSLTMDKEQTYSKSCPKNQKLDLQAAEIGPEVMSRPGPEALLEPCNSDSEAEVISKSNKRCKPGDDGEDPHLQQAKRACLGRPPATAQADYTESSTQTSIHDLPPPLPFPPPVQVKTMSKAFPVLECKKTTLEVELLTPGKQAQRLPLTSNNTAQTIQNRPATSLRALSVKPASSGSSIGSRSTLGEEGSENVPRTSRLRRTKRS